MGMETSMKTKDKFEETKMKMVMKLKKLNREAAERDVADQTGCKPVRMIGRGEVDLLSDKDFMMGL